MAERISVWYLIGSLQVGGTERTLVDLASELDRERFDPVIWTIAAVGPLADDVPDDIPVKSLGARSKADLRAPLRFVWALRKEQPDIVQSFLFFDNILARLAGVFAPEVTVITGVREVPDKMATTRELFDRMTLPLSDYVVSNSSAGAEWVINRGADREKVSVIYNGRDVATYDVSLPDGYRETISVPTGPIVGTVGRLVKRKGHHDLLDAWPAVRENHPDAQLVIVGDGPEGSSLKAHTRRLRIEKSVHFLGRRDDVPELLALFDVFAFPSHYEGLPGALLEAMCAGLPIVTTPVDGCSELVADGEHGIHVPVRDPEALGDAIVKLLNNDKRADVLGGNAARRARDEFSTDAMVNGFEALYDILS